MIGQPKFWYGGMLQQAAAGRFLGYGGMRQTGVGDFTYTFTHHARARRGLDFGDEHRNRCLGHRLAFLTTKSCTTRQTFQNATPRQLARHDKRFRMQLPVNLSWVGGPHIKTLVGGSARGINVCSPAFRVRYWYHLWKVAVRGTGVCSVGRPPDRPQCMGVCLKSFSVRRSYPDPHLFGIRGGVCERDDVKLAYRYR